MRKYNCYLHYSRCPADKESLFSAGFPLLNYDMLKVVKFKIKISILLNNFYLNFFNYHSLTTNDKCYNRKNY